MNFSFCLDEFRSTELRESSKEVLEFSSSFSFFHGQTTENELLPPKNLFCHVSTTGSGLFMFLNNLFRPSLSSNYFT